jgi:hypothetical protein
VNCRRYFLPAAIVYNRDGSPHWAFSCYGLKVEKAHLVRRKGHRITLAHESDFWDALAGHGLPT